MNGPRGTGAMERVAREKEALINILADKPPEVITYAMWRAFYDTAQAIERAEWLKGNRCSSCGGMKLSQLSDTCANCMETQ